MEDKSRWESARHEQDSLITNSPKLKFFRIIYKIGEAHQYVDAYFMGLSLMIHSKAFGVYFVVVQIWQRHHKHTCCCLQYVSFSTHAVSIFTRIYPKHLSFNLSWHSVDFGIHMSVIQTNQHIYMFVLCFQYKVKQLFLFVMNTQITIQHN
jgi:hypothetical protein